MKKIKAVAPYRHPDNINFKFAPYKAWVEAGGETAAGHYPPRWMHGLAYRIDMPSLHLCRDTRMLMFVEPVSIGFDTWPYYMTHEVVPFIWDCWPCHYDKMERWMRRHKVKMAFFTSRDEMAAMQARLPEVEMHHCPEAVDTSLYHAGKSLTERSIDLLEFGRSNERLLGDGKGLADINHVTTMVDGRFIYSNEQLFHAMADAKVTICLPRSMTHPEIAGGVETLTQRYWEAMLSRIVMVGHAPQELIDLIGYNPCIEIDATNPCKQIKDIIAHISDYQALVDRNREIALTVGDWSERMKRVMGLTQNFI